MGTRLLLPTLAIVRSILLRSRNIYIIPPESILAQVVLTCPCARFKAHRSSLSREI